MLSGVDRREATRVGRGTKKKKQENSAGRTTQTEDENERGKRRVWKKPALPAKHFFLLKFARASRAKTVYHPRPSRSPFSSLSPAFT